MTHLILGLLVSGLVCAFLTKNAECIEQFSRKSNLAVSGNQYRMAYTTAYFTQPVDHFSFSEEDTFQMRYLYNIDNWNKNGGPILFYCGNEGDIEVFANNTGFMWDISGKLNAMVVFAEHRYYGKSLPYGNDSFKDAQHLGYLTSEQALADYALFLPWFKSTQPGAASSPVIAFGGSYGGMLAAWMRAKYPHIVIGALAASAPVLQFQGVTACESYNQIVTQTFARYGNNCVENIRQSWGAINDMFSSGASGQQFLQSTFNVCSNLSKASDLQALKDWISGAWGNIAMVEYPYPANFLQNLPAWPIKSVCSYLQQPWWKVPKIHLVQMAAAVNAYFNYSGSYPGKCYDITGEPDQLGADLGWNFQACSEMVMPMCADNVQDFFEPAAWNLTSVVSGCAKQYGIVPRPYWVLNNYLGTQLKGASNIIFSNGLLDPWHGGGVLQSIPAQGIVAITIPNGAHHLDLRSANENDPADVIAARAIELDVMSQWIAQAMSNN